MAVTLSPFAKSIFDHKYAHKTKDGGLETWEQTSRRVVRNVMKSVNIDFKDPLAQKLYQAIKTRKFLPGGRYLYAAGRPFHQTQNCLLLRAEDSREGWADLMQKSTMALMTGAGIGIDYSSVRAEGAAIRKTGGTSTGPIALMKMINEAGRQIMQGGSRRSAIWAGLSWRHSDVLKFIKIKNWSTEVKKLKDKDFNFPADLDGTNISVILDKEFFDAYANVKHKQHTHAQAVYWMTIEQMLSTAEPGFSVDYDNPKESLRNACTEVVSEDDSDICNLGSINLANVDTIDELRELVDICTAFLVAGTVYSDLPYPKVDQVRTKNRRLGLGLMGVHEWLLKRGKTYDPDAELDSWLWVYTGSKLYADKWTNEWGLTPCIKTRAIAPTGSIGIIAETTTGIEPIFCVAYKRRFLKNGTEWRYQYVVDPTAKRLIDSGIDPDKIEDAYSLATNIERRVAFQAWIQNYVDQSISSTINFPSWGSELNNEATIKPFGKMLMDYLPKLRGITTYPDGCRGGQPLTPVKYTTARNHVGEEYVEESVDICDIKGGASCGS